jgi:glycosyltransferase involved in cell wall biosynthesis
MNLRVCMLIARFYPQIGGTEIQALRLSRALMAEGIDVFVVTQKLGKLKRFEEVDGLKINRLFSFGEGKFASFIFMLSSLVFLIKKREDYDIIHVHLASSPAITAVILSKLLDKKVILKFGGAGRTGDIKTSVKTPLGRWKIKFIRNKFDAFVVPTREIKNELINNNFPENRIHHIFNGVNIDIFKPVDRGQKPILRQQIGIPDENLVIYAGRLDEGKGVDILLKSWPLVLRQLPEANLLIAGEGVLKKQLTEQVKNTEYQSKINFIGKTDNIEKYLGISDVFVLPSLAEGLSNALLEAMSCGLAIITSDIPANREIIINKVNGLLVPASDIEKLAGQIVFLLRSPNERELLGLKARDSAEKNYSIKSVVKNYVSLYNKLI